MRGATISFPESLAQRYAAKKRVQILAADGQPATAPTLRVETQMKIRTVTPKQKEQSDTEEKTVEIIDATRGWFMVEIDGEYVMKDDGLSPKKFRKEDAEKYVETL